MDSSKSWAETPFSQLHVDTQSTPYGLLRECSSLWCMVQKPAITGLFPPKAKVESSNMRRDSPRSQKSMDAVTSASWLYIIYLFADNCNIRPGCDRVHDSSIIVRGHTVVSCCRRPWLPLPIDMRKMREQWPEFFVLQSPSITYTRADDTHISLTRVSVLTFVGWFVNASIKSLSWYHLSIY
jgi:hypothetical protein